MEWDVEKLIDDVTQRQKELETQVAAFTAWREQLATLSPDDFSKAVQDYAAIAELMSRLIAHAKLQSDANTADQAARTLLSTTQRVLSTAQNDIRFFTLWWKELDNVTDYLPLLGKDTYVFQHMRALRDHTLSEKEENIISLKDATGTAALNTLYGMIDSRLQYDFNGKQLVAEELTAKFSDPDPTVRKQAYETYYTTKEKEADVFAEVYKNLILNWENERKLRSFSSAITIRNMSNDLPDEVVQHHLDACREAAPLWQRYFALKGKILGKPLTRYDIYAPITTTQKTYTFDEALTLTLDAFNSFSPKLHDLAQEIYKGGFVDALPRKHKRGGAFCWGVTPDLPPYLMYNFTGKLRDVSTIAHETGHGVHHQLCRHLTPLSCDHALPIAETASVFAEMLLTEKLMADDPAVKKALLAQKLDDMYATIGRQSFFVLFEIAAHDLFKQGATPDDVSKKYMDLLHEQFGDIQVPDIFKHEWLAIPHFFQTPFYCYAYSFGNLLTLALYQQYKKEGVAFVPKYEAFLAAGETTSPIELCNEIGIDISNKTFWQEGFTLIEDMLDELEQLV